MEIYTTTKDSSVIFKMCYSRFERIFIINLINNKLKLSAYAHGPNAGSKIDGSQADLWSFFLRLLEDGTVKSNLEFVD